MIDELLLDEQAEIWYQNPYVTHKQVNMNDTSILFSYPDKNCFIIAALFIDIIEEILQNEGCNYILNFMKE